MSTHPQHPQHSPFTHKTVAETKTSTKTDTDVDDVEVEDKDAKKAKADAKVKFADLPTEDCHLRRHLALLIDSGSKDTETIEEVQRRLAEFDAATAAAKAKAEKK